MKATEALWALDPLRLGAGNVPVPGDLPSAGPRTPRSSGLMRSGSGGRGNAGVPALESPLSQVTGPSRPRSPAPSPCSLLAQSLARGARPVPWAVREAELRATRGQAPCWATGGRMGRFHTPRCPVGAAVAWALRSQHRVGRP